MFIKKISIINYKSIPQMDIEFAPKINCFVGNNGQGKTNLLDSIYYLSMCKSALNTADSLIATHGEAFFMLRGEYYRKSIEESIYCGFKQNTGKVFKRNGNEYQRLSDHIGLLPIVIVSPADTELISDSSDERRKYMNSVIAQYDKLYLDEVIRYNRTLSQRNSLLKAAATTSQLNTDLVEALDEQLSIYGSSIYEKRQYFINQLIPIFKEYYALVSDKNEDVSLAYRSHLHKGHLADMLKSSIGKDRALQHTSVGVHRDDMVLTLNGYPIKREGSQGQQKTYLIALRLAQFNFMSRVTSMKPILLLDDIFDKLDMERVKKLIEVVSRDEFGQIFITDTNPNRINEVITPNSIDYKLFEIVNGNAELIAPLE